MARGRSPAWSTTATAGFPSGFVPAICPARSPRCADWRRRRVAIRRTSRSTSTGSPPTRSSSRYCATRRSPAPSLRCRRRVPRRCCRSSTATPRRCGRSRRDDGTGPRWVARGAARRLERAGRRRLAVPRVGLALRSRGIRRRVRRDRMAAAAPDGVGRRSDDRRVSAVREGSQPGRVRLRPPLGVCCGPRAHPLLPEAPRRGAVHSRDRTAVARGARGARPGRDSPRGRPRGRLHEPGLLVGARELLPRGRPGGALGARLAPADGLPVPLDQPGLSHLRRLPGEPSQQAPLPGAPRAGRAGRAGSHHRDAGRRRHPGGAAARDVPPLPPHRRHQSVGTPLPERALLRARGGATPGLSVLRRGPAGRGGHRRHFQHPEGRHAVRPLLGRLPGPALPPLQRLLLRGHRALHRAGAPALRARCGRGVQAAPGLRRDRDGEHALDQRRPPARRRGGPSRGGAGARGRRGGVARGAHGAEAGPGRRLVSRAERALPWAVGALAVAYRLAYPLAIGPADESYLLFGARRVLAGEAIYRDFFEPLTPLAYQFYAVVLALGGETLRAARVADALVNAIGCGLLFVLARRIAGPAEAVVACVAFVMLALPCWPYASPHWLSTTLWLGVAAALLSERLS